jgi:hypothetical protein
MIIILLAILIITVWLFKKYKKNELPIINKKRIFFDKLQQEKIPEDYRKSLVDTLGDLSIDNGKHTVFQISRIEDLLEVFHDMKSKGFTDDFILTKISERHNLGDTIDDIISKEGNPKVRRKDILKTKVKETLSYTKNTAIRLLEEVVFTFDDGILVKIQEISHR